MNRIRHAGIARAERAHYSLQSALFIRERRDLSGASLFSAGEIPDPEWNHAGLVTLDPAALAETLDLAREFFHARGLPAAFAVSPASEPPDLEARLADHGFAPCFRHTWHFLSGHFLSGSDPDPVELPGGFDVRVVESEGEMRDFVDVFERVYAVDLETGEPDEATGYGQALLRSFREGRPGLRVVHHLATSADEPAGVATSIHGESASGLYNLAVLPGFRRRGLGGALVRRRAADALALGRKTVFLQTERKPVERRLRRHGFTKGFTTVGLVEES